MSESQTPKPAKLENRHLGIPLTLAERKDLTLAERAACLLLTRWAVRNGLPTMECWVSNESFAWQCGLKIPAARAVLKRLAKKGVIKVAYDRTKTNAEQRVITLSWRDDFTPMPE